MKFLIKHLIKHYWSSIQYHNRNDSIQKVIYLNKSKSNRNKSSEFSDPPGPTTLSVILFCTHVRTCSCTDGRTDVRTDVRTDTIIKTNYHLWPWGLVGQYVIFCCAHLESALVFGSSVLFVFEQLTYVLGGDSFTS